VDLLPFADTAFPDDFSGLSFWLKHIVILIEKHEREHE